MAGVSPTVHPYRYPTQVKGRRHGPSGYKSYQDFRPWLEDEFQFRCVYCLKRQKWARTDIWSVDHLVPQSLAPDLECHYDNLILSCQWCNNRKLADSVPDPAAIAYGNCLRVDDDSGEVRALSEDGLILIRVLKLNHQDQIRTRLDTLRTLKILAIHAPNDWKRIMGFPEELPDLGRKRPPGGNSRPNGIPESYFEQHQRDELPEVYE